MQAAEFSVHVVLRRSVSTVFANLGACLFLAAVIESPILATLAWALASRTPTGAFPNLQTYTYVHLVGGFILKYVLTGALISVVVQRLRNRSIGPVDALLVVLRRIVPVVGVGLLVGLIALAAPALLFALGWVGKSPMMMGLGTLAGLVPALMLYCRFWFAVPSAVLERPGVLGALRRSTGLTDGIRWKIFGVTIVIAGLQFVVSMAITLTTRTVRDGAGDMIFAQVAQAVAGIVFNVWIAAATGAGFHEIRRIRENVDIEDVAAVFD
jgi:hypothetical protein